MMYRDYPERYSIVGDAAFAPVQALRDRLNRKARIQRSVAIAIIAFATGLAAVGLPFAVVEWVL